MSITIESSDNKEHFRRWGYDRFYAFYVEYIPKHLPKWGTPDKDGLHRDWTQSFEGYTSIIDYVVDEAIKTIIERPENNVVEFQLKALKNTIDLWTLDWDKEFAIYAICTFHSLDAPQTSDAYMTLYTMGYIDDEEPKKQPQSNKVINSMKWIHNKPIGEAIEVLEPLSYLFEEGSLEGLKMALGGGNIYDMRGCIKPSNGNKTAVLFFIHHLSERGYIQEAYSMDEVIRILTDSKGRYTKQKSLFLNDEFTLSKKKLEHIFKTLDAIPS